MQTIKVYTVIGVYKGALDQANIFSSYEKAQEYATWLKNTVYRGVHNNTELVITQREVDNKTSIW